MTVIREIATRWIDNDVYGHVNNTVYFSYFDTAVNGWLIEATGVDIRQLPAIGIVAEVSCRYLKEIRFPDILQVAIDIERLGNSSIVYDLKIHRQDELAATGRFVHVYVDSQTRRPVPIPDIVREVVAKHA
ncbi:acyl-CoA thioesterase [Fodinicola acaciae]|uniref:acyl-CoA thioesterase n=1 Tax=Fodinicola acaciae TaxID=2681555 RepID=UPI0016527F24|nr:thioesterase family protein [Fodinicola acaciae]